MSEQPTLTIRRAVPGDLDDIMAIEEVSFPTPWNRVVMASELRLKSSRYLAAELDGRLVGYAGMSCFAGEAHIMNIAVAPECRRRGLGEALLLRLLHNAVELRCGIAYLECRAGNVAADALYRKLGFQRVGRRANYYRDTGEDAILMTMDDLPATWSARLAAYWETWEKRHGCRLLIK